jgi:hypothetical protein
VRLVQPNTHWPRKLELGEKNDIALAEAESANAFLPTEVSAKWLLMIFLR